MDKTNIRKILTSVLAVLLIFSMFTETAFALSGDGSHIGHTGGGSSVSGAYLVPSSNADHHVGFRFSWLTLGTDGYYSRKAALDVFYKGYNLLRVKLHRHTVVACVAHGRARLNLPSKQRQVFQPSVKLGKQRRVVGAQRGDDRHGYSRL